MSWRSRTCFETTREDDNLPEGEYRSTSLHLQSYNATELTLVYKCKAQTWTFQDPMTQFQKIRKAHNKTGLAPA
jgi:hypothetical protein